MFKVSRIPPTPVFDRDNTSSDPAPRVDVMDVDEHELGMGSSFGGRRTVVTPGEVITSSKEYMRCVQPSPLTPPVPHPLYTY